MTLYHCTHKNLSINDIIEPGSWGRKIFEIGPAHRSWFREIILEAVRITYFPNKPSRFASIFACDNLKSMQHYKSSHCPDGFIYEVIFTNSHSPQHKGDFNAVEPMPRCSKNMWQIAKEYWEYKLKTMVSEWPDIECSEIVSNSPLKVLGKIT